MNSDYPRVADDLVRLGFVPEDRADPEKTAAVVPQLTRVMSQLIQGGGVRKINVQQVQICKGTWNLVNLKDALGKVVKYGLFFLFLFRGLLLYI
jgi:hypothetical protein